MKLTALSIDDLLGKDEKLTFLVCAVCSVDSLSNQQESTNLK
jgi:hypothetical protein